MERIITIIPIGDIESWILDDLTKKLEATFSCRTKIYTTIPLPQKAYNPGRNQYYSSHLLQVLHRHLTPSKHEKVLAIVNVDLYVPQLNFVFGEAELGGHFAIISLSRLHQSFYGLAENKKLFLERTLKEAVHELGHTYGLRHCPDAKCVMHFSNSLQDTDKKSSSFCRHCQKLLDEIIGFE
ncbi:MAG: archaemetzincin family Zn-dependent metalloprotease [Thermotogota bacterium]|nr:archaemetzincin family Zn-dependent metalloprotease [Thermotogota bacterium]